MQLDISHCINGGGDPYATLKKFPGLCQTLHVTEHGGNRGATIGEGTVSGPRTSRFCETVGGIERYIVEQETYDHHAAGVRQAMLRRDEEAGQGVSARDED